MFTLGDVTDRLLGLNGRTGAAAAASCEAGAVTSSGDEGIVSYIPSSLSGVISSSSSSSSSANETSSPVRDTMSQRVRDAVSHGIYVK